MSIIRNFIFALTAFVFTFSCSDKPASMDIDIMSFNIRLDRDDGINSWKYRMPIVQSYLNQTSPDIIGFQEPLENQVKDLEEMLDAYEWVGDGRNEDRRGEACPVFFKKEVFTLLNHDTFWVSETPHLPGSIGPGANLPRIVTWVELKHNDSGKIVFFFNTHFSHVSPDARKLATQIMSSKMNKIADKHLMIALGDFNLLQGGDEYEFLTEQFGEHNSLSNVQYLADYVNMGKTTFNGYSRDRERIIDFIFVSDLFSVSLFQIDEIVENEVFISDHWPLRATIHYPGF